MGLSRISGLYLVPLSGADLNGSEVGYFPEVRFQE